MKSSTFLCIAILFLICFQIDTNAKPLVKRPLPKEVKAPLSSAYEAFTKYQTGRAILLHAGDTGQGYFKRHIQGAIFVPWNQIKKGERQMVNFPKKA